MFSLWDGLGCDERGVQYKLRHSIKNQNDIQGCKAYRKCSIKSIFRHVFLGFLLVINDQANIYVSSISNLHMTVVLVKAVLGDFALLFNSLCLHICLLACKSFFMRKCDSIVHAVTLPCLGQHVIIRCPRAKSERVTFGQLKGRVTVQDPVSQILSEPSTMSDTIPGSQKTGQASYVHF